MEREIMKAAVCMTAMAAIAAWGQQDIVNNSTADNIVLGRNVNWGCKGVGCIENNYILSGLGSRPSVCLSVQNLENAPHDLRVTAWTSSDPSNVTFQNNQNAWIATPWNTYGTTGGIGTVTIPASSSRGFLFNIPFAAHVAISISQTGVGGTRANIFVSRSSTETGEATTDLGDLGAYSNCGGGMLSNFQSIAAPALGVTGGSGYQPLTICNRSQALTVLAGANTTVANDFVANQKSQIRVCGFSVFEVGTKIDGQFAFEENTQSNCGGTATPLWQGQVVASTGGSGTLHASSPIFRAVTIGQFLCFHNSTTDSMLLNVSYVFY
jgi:hypothetical protein